MTDSSPLARAAADDIAARLKTDLGDAYSVYSNREAIAGGQNSIAVVQMGEASYERPYIGPVRKETWPILIVAQSATNHLSAASAYADADNIIDAVSRIAREHPTLGGLEGVQRLRYHGFTTLIHFDDRDDAGTYQRIVQYHANLELEMRLSPT